MANNTRSLLVNVLKQMCREGITFGFTEDAVDNMSFQALLDFFNANININLAEPSADAGDARQLNNNDTLSKVQQINWSKMDDVKQALEGSVFSLKNKPYDIAIALDSDLNFRVYDSFDNAKMLLDNTEKKIKNLEDRIERLSDDYTKIKDKVNSQPKPKKPGFFARLFNTSSNKKYKDYLSELKQVDQKEHELKESLKVLDQYTKEKEDLLHGDPRANALEGDNPEPVIKQPEAQKEVAPEVVNEAPKVNNGINPDEINIVEADDDEDVIDYDPNEVNIEEVDEEELAQEAANEVVNNETKTEEVKEVVNNETKTEEVKEVVNANPIEESLSEDEDALDLSGDVRKFFGKKPVFTNEEIELDQGDMNGLIDKIPGAELSDAELSDAIVTATVEKIKEITALNDTVYNNNNVLNQYLEDVKNLGVDISYLVSGEKTSIDSKEFLDFAASAMLSEQLRNEHIEYNDGVEKGGMINIGVGPIERLTEKNGLATVESTKKTLEAYKTLPAVKKLAEDMQDSPDIFIDAIKKPEKVFNPVFDDVKKQYKEYLDLEAKNERQKAFEEEERQFEIKQNRKEHYGIYVHHDEKENTTVYLNENDRDIGYSEYKKIVDAAEAQKAQEEKAREEIRSAAEMEEAVRAYEERRFEQELQRQREPQELNEEVDLTIDEGAAILLESTVDAADNINEANKQLYNNNPVLGMLAEDMLEAGQNYAKFLTGEVDEKDMDLFVNLAASLVLSEQLEDKEAPVNEARAEELLEIYKRIPAVQSLADNMADEVDTFINTIKDPSNSIRPMLKEVDREFAKFGKEIMSRMAKEKSFDENLVEPEEKEVAPEKSGFSMNM